MFAKMRRLLGTVDHLPDATPEELDDEDDQCVFCYERLESDVKKLHCGHMYHKKCLKNWFQTGEDVTGAVPKCPKCRVPITSRPTANQTATANAANANNSEINE